MIYVHAEDQDDPHSDMLVQIKGTGNLIAHESYTLLNYIFEQDSDMFIDIVRAVIRLHPKELYQLMYDPDDE